MQLFDDCDCKSCSLDDKQHLENMHDEGYTKLIQILDTNQSVEQLSSQMYHKAMCDILEGFFREVDYVLPPPPPTIIQVYNVIIEQILTLTLNVDYSRFSKVYLN